MTYEDYKQNLYLELGRQLDETNKKLVVIGEGTANEEIAVEISRETESMCSQSLSLWHLYNQYCRYTMPNQVDRICDYFDRVRLIKKIEQLDNVTIWAANLEKSAKKLEENETPYVTVGDIAVYFKFFDEVYEVSKEDGEVWPNDYIRPVCNKHLEQWGFTAQELFDKAKYFDVGERLQTVLDASKDAFKRVLGSYEQLLPDTYGIYSITGENGIGMMFYPVVLSQVAQRLGGDLFVIPILNDRILVCSKNEYNLEKLQEVVKMKSKEDKLYGLIPLPVSDMVFQFDAHRLTLQPATDQREKKMKHTAR